MRHKLPKYVRRKVSKGKAYLYYETGILDDNGKMVSTRLPSIDDPTFGRALGDAAAARTKRGNVPNVLTVAALASQFEKSQEFARLASASRDVYSLYLKQIRERLGIAHAAELTKPDVIQIRDKMEATPGAANMLVRTLGALYKWGRKREVVQNHPTKELEPLEQGEHEPWPDWLLDEALKDPAVQLPVALLYYTALRIGDACALRWVDIKADVIEVMPQKTSRKKVTLWIPVHRNLRAILGTAPRAEFTGFPILKGWTKDSLRRHLQAWAKDRNQKIVPHGLRKNAVNALLEAGCSVAQTASISGQTLQMVEHYAKRRDQAALGKAAMLTWEARTNRDSENKSEN